MFKEIVILCLISSGCVSATLIKDDYLERFKRDDDKTLTLRSYFINSFVQNHFATVRYASHVVNEHFEEVNSTFVVPIPKNTFISNVSVYIDGVEYVGKAVLNENISIEDNGTNTKSILTAQVRQRYMGLNNNNERNIFEIDLTLAALKETTFIVTYYERFILKDGHYKQRLIVEPGQVVESLLVSAIFVENQGFETFSYLLAMSNESHESSSAMATLLESPTKRSILYQLSRDQQSSSSSKGVDGELIIEYQLNSTNDAGMVDVQGDYFVHYFTPSGLKPIDKNIIFVLDKSGSMSGTKIEQLRESMLIILDNLNPNDNFNILIFESTTDTLFRDPVEANLQNIQKAKILVRNSLNATGGTAINDALLKSITSLKALPNKKRRAQVIFFLTDGQASTGETNNTAILKNVREANDGSISIYCLGFGNNADDMFLEDLATENSGIYARISVDAEAKEELINIYMQIKDPLLLDVVISYDSQYVILESTSNNKFLQYFNGTEIIVTGRLKRPGILPAEAVLVQGISKDGNLSLTMDKKAVVVRPKDTKERNNKIYDEAVTIKDLLFFYAKTYDNDHKDNIVKIAMQYNLVTPFTSYVLEVADRPTVNGINGATSQNCLGVTTKTCFLFCAFSIRFLYI